MPERFRSHGRTQEDLELDLQDCGPRFLIKHVVIFRFKDRNTAIEFRLRYGEDIIDDSSLTDK